MGGKKCQNPFQAILRPKKKVAWTTMGGGGKTLVVRPLKKHFFICVLLNLHSNTAQQDYVFNKTFYNVKEKE